MLACLSTTITKQTRDFYPKSEWNIYKECSMAEKQKKNWNKSKLKYKSWNIELIRFFMDRFAVKDFFSFGVIIPNIKNEIYYSDYLCMVNLMTTSACCWLKRITYSKRIYRRFVSSSSLFNFFLLKYRWLLNFYFELLLVIHCRTCIFPGLLVLRTNFKV